MSAWERYRAGSNVQPDAEVYEFIKCLSEELRTSATHAYPNLLTLDISDVVHLSKSTAVIPVSVCVRRSEALQCKQKQGETFRHFSTSVRGALTDCDFTVPCPHATNGPRCAVVGCTGVDYTDSVVRDILLAGIYDVEIRRNVLSDSSMASRPINKIISIVEGKESARDAVSATPRAPAPEAAAATSSFKSSGKLPAAGAPPRAPKPRVQKSQQDLGKTLGQCSPVQRRAVRPLDGALRAHHRRADGLAHQGPGLALQGAHQGPGLALQGLR